MAHRWLRGFALGLVAAALAAFAGGGVASAAGRTYHWNARSRHVLLTDVQNTLGQGSVQLDGSIHVAMGSKGGDVHLQGGFDLTKKQGNFNVDIALGSVPSISVHEVLSDGTFYVQIPSGQWYSVSLAAFQAQQGLSGSLLGGSNPTDFLSLIQQEGGQVAQTGSATLSDGTQVTNYHVLVNLDSANGAHQASGAPAFDSTRLHQLENALGGHTIAFDTQVDAQGRVRTLSCNLSVDPSALGAPSGTGSVGVALSFSFSNYGAPVSVTVPPPSEVQPLPTSGFNLKA